MDILGVMSEQPGQLDILNRIRTIFARSLELSLTEDQLAGVTRISAIAGVDSMAALVFVAAVEKEFGIAIEPEMLDLEIIEDLPRLAAYVEACVEGRSQA